MDEKEKDEDDNDEEILRSNENKKHNETIDMIRNNNKTLDNNCKRKGFNTNTQFLTNTYIGELPVLQNAWILSDNKNDNNNNNNENNESKNDEIIYNINTLPFPNDESKKSKKKEEEDKNITKESKN
jgi:hypothetical protein